MTDVEQVPSISRRSVPAKTKYSEYLEDLKWDFFYSCGYCTITEAEASSIRMTIDHYAPRTERPDLVNDYSNLIYCCDMCNLYKGNRCEPEAARAAGYRFYRPDVDNFRVHFELSGIRILGKSILGTYSIEALELNRYPLRRLRELRARLRVCDGMVLEGVLALKQYKIDRLPPYVRAIARRNIDQIGNAAETFADDIETILRRYAASPLSGTDPDDEDRRKERSQYFAEVQAAYPGNWRASARQK